MVFDSAAMEEWQRERRSEPEFEIPQRPLTFFSMAPDSAAMEQWQRERQSEPEFEIPQRPLTFFSLPEQIQDKILGEVWPQYGIHVFKTPMGRLSHAPCLVDPDIDDDELDDREKEISSYIALPRAVRGTQLDMIRQMGTTHENSSLVDGVHDLWSLRRRFNLGTEQNIV